MQKGFLIFSIVVLHILWIISIKLYYDTTYKKYLETYSDFDWAFVFKKKKLPYTEKYEIRFAGEKIGGVIRRFSTNSKLFYITTQAYIDSRNKKLFHLPLGFSTIILSIEIEFTPLYNINNFNLTLSTKGCAYMLPCPQKNILSITGKRVNNVLQIKLNSTIPSMLPYMKDRIIGLEDKYLKSSFGQSFLLFGSRPAVGKSWTIKLGTFGEINAIVDEKFIKEDKNGEKGVIYSVSYSSDRPKINGYSWINENGELLKLVIYKPDITIVKEGLQF